MRSRHRKIAGYDYLSGELLRNAYLEATGKALPADQAGDLPMVARKTERYLLRHAEPLETARPGGYLHISAMRLPLADRSAGPGSWTAVLFAGGDTGTPPEGSILPVLVGPVENCRDWKSDGASPRMPTPATSSAMEQVIMAMARYEGSGGPAMPAPTAAQALAERLLDSREREAVARVLIREPAQPPYAAVVIGTPVWVRRMLVQR